MTHNLTEILTILPDIEGVQRCDIESVIPHICSETVDDFCERVKPSKVQVISPATLLETKSFAGRKHIFIVNLFSVKRISL